MTGGRLRSGGLALLLLTAAALLFPSLGEAPFERAEIYFMDGARAMVERGDHVVPHYQGVPFFDKPALSYWLMASSFRLFGFTPEAARLVSALAALGVIAATVWLGALLLGRRSALTGALVLVTTLAFVSFGRVAMSDMLLALWSTLAAAVAVAAVRPGAPAWLLPVLGAVLGLGFLTKGPVAVLLPGLAIVLLPWRRREWGRGSALAVGLAASLFALLGLGWFLAVYLQLGAAPLEYFFLRENLERFAAETYDTGRPLWYFLPTYLAEGLPWSLFFPVAALRLVDRKGDDEKTGARLLLLWIGLMLVPLSLSRGKLDYYLLPLYPAISLVIGRHLAGPWNRVDRVWARVVLILAASGFTLIALGPGPLPDGWLPGRPARLTLAAIAAAGALLCAAAAVRVTAARATAALAGSVTAVFLVLANCFLPAFHAAQPNRAIAEDVARERLYRPDLRVVACSDPARVRRDILFYARTTTIERCDLWSFASSRLPFLMLLGPEERASLRRLPGYREIGEHRYLPATALTGTGFLSQPEPGDLVLAANYPTTDPVAEAKRKRDFKRAVRAWEDYAGGR